LDSSSVWNVAPQVVESYARRFASLSPALQPVHVVCPEQYTQPPLTQSHRSDLMLELQPPPMPYRRCSVLSLPHKRRYERVYILPEVGHVISPVKGI